MLDKSNMANRLKKVVADRLLELERNPFDAAARAKLERSYLNDILIGKKKSVRQDKMDSLATALDWSIADLNAHLTGSAPLAGRVPIVGKAGAGPSGSVLFSETDGELGEAPAVPGSDDETVALEVVGDSMRGIAEDGWLIYYDDRRAPIEPDMYGEVCVIGLADGRVLVKMPWPSRQEGLFDLESATAPTMRGQVVEWGALVTAIIPRKAARKIVRNPVRRIRR